MRKHQISQLSNDQNLPIANTYKRSARAGFVGLRGRTDVKIKFSARPKKEIKIWSEPETIYKILARPGPLRIK